ncbi:hypothetical protein sos41_22840 [Alphaproteobacteria bacterium SO-S41]|nr:hypothetical protein sos41_22840 [Alphaproteobacteria bacterium SO-S41]
MNRGDWMARSNQPIEHLYFPTEGVGSVVAGIDGRQLEIGVFGREGMSGTAFAYGVGQSPYDTYMQVPGVAWRVAAAALRDAAAGAPDVQRILVRYAYAFSVQTAETAFANALFSLEQRLARWLLMCHDRLDGDEIAITHELLSVMLGVRRPAVTLAVQTIEGAGMVRATRAKIEIRDREKLIAVAGGAYGTSGSEYRRVVPVSAAAAPTLQASSPEPTHVAS